MTEYKVMYCGECNAVITTTEDEMDCLHCGGPSEEIGFVHEVIQSILDYEVIVTEDNLEDM